MQRNNDYGRQSKKANVQKKRNYDVEYISSCMALVQEQIQVLEPLMTKVADCLSSTISRAMRTYQEMVGSAAPFQVSAGISTRERIFILFRVLGITIQQISKFDPQGADWLNCISRNLVSEFFASSLLVEAMTISFYVYGYAVNKRGNTVGIHYDVQSTDDQRAIKQAEKQAKDDGLRYIRFTRVINLEAHHA